VFPRLRERPDERGIIHCHSRELQQTVSQHLQREFDCRILTHGSRNDRDAGVARLRNSRNGVLCAVAMTEGLDLRDDDARFCIFAKIPWSDLSDPYTAERRKRSQEWYENVTALSVIQGSGRVVRNDKD
jgi:Rad3-related DNA helicase